MGSLNVLWYLLAGFVLGWLSSTLLEWLWFRGRRSRVDRGPTAGRARRHREPMGEREGRAPGAPHGSDSGVLADVPPRSASVSAAVSATIANAGAPEARPDNLSQIRGIGDVYEQRLYGAGIFTWHQLSRTDPDVLRAVTKALPSSNPQSWIEQARELAVEHGRVGATYSGPLPDDLTRIEGIDQVYAGELYKAGIFTFAQLAASTPEILSRIIPAHTVGDPIDFMAWIEQAVALRNAA